jgi:AAA15 family ATPase/GTPase
MLLKYIVSNYKSIGHNIEFSMLPTKYSKDESFLTPIQTKQGMWKVLRRGAFFGPNASGKSNLVKSMRFACEYITEIQKSGQRTGVSQFKGDFKDLNGLSTFQFLFFYKGEVYDYGFSMDMHHIFEEWLMILTPNGFQPMFTRESIEGEKNRIEITDYLAPKSSTEREMAELLTLSIQKNQKNQLFLNKLAENGNEKAENIMNWFSSICFILPDSKFQKLELSVKDDEEFREFLSYKLRTYDTGVNVLSVTSEHVDFIKTSKLFDFPDEFLEDENMKKS